MRIFALSALFLAVSIGQTAACEGGVVAMIYQPKGAAFIGEVNGVPVADALKPGEDFTGTRRLPPWLLPGQNEVMIEVMTPSPDGVAEVFLNCPGVFPESAGKNPNSFGVAKLDKPGRQTFSFEAPAGSIMDLPYSNAMHEGDEGLDAAVKRMQAAFRAKDADAVADQYRTMAKVAQAMGEPVTYEQFKGMLGQVLPQADVTFLDEYEIRPAMGGRLRIVTGRDRVTPPVFMEGERFRMESARIWSFINGDWRLVAK